MNSDLIFYHIYPLGLCNAPKTNEFYTAPLNRLTELYKWGEHISELGCNAVYFGPVFESGSHGYDTADYFMVDRRLGSNGDFADLCREYKRMGIKIVLDGVFNHCGRNFWAFRDVQFNRENSRFKDWFSGLNFSGNNQYNDNFSYDNWNGYNSLVKFNLNNVEVRSHLFHAISTWVDEFDIDGLRLDAADCLDFEFIEELSKHCKRIKGDFILLGEVIHGDYTKWANDKMLDTVTNYECYKGLFSSHNDNNYFEIAYSLNRQFGRSGLYKNLNLYNFVDNHDVNRIASILKEKKNIIPVYTMLFTMPGVPSIYYGSEFGIEGEKQNNSDDNLRPYLDFEYFNGLKHTNEVYRKIKELISLRREKSVLQNGNYRQLLVESCVIAYVRELDEEKAIVVVNNGIGRGIEINSIDCDGVYKVNGSEEEIIIENGKLKIDFMNEHSGLILIKK